MIQMIRLKNNEWPLQIGQLYYYNEPEEEMYFTVLQFHKNDNYTVLVDGKVQEWNLHDLWNQIYHPVLRH